MTAAPTIDITGLVAELREVAAVRRQASADERNKALFVVAKLSRQDGDLMERAAALLESLRATIERVERERDEARRETKDWQDAAHLSACEAQSGLLDEAWARVTALEAEKAGLVKAVTPSPKTKAAYIGEFHFDWTVWDPKGEEQITHRVQVPWTTIKQIMSAIRAQALSRSTEVNDG